MKEQSDSTHTQSRRVFLPLKRQAFNWFKSGEKDWELRGYGRSYQPHHLKPGTRVELRNGYRGESLWGVIGKCYVAESLDAIFERIDFRRIIPSATNTDEAKKIAVGILGSKTHYIAFEVRRT
jgi:hypothetical protein